MLPPLRASGDSAADTAPATWSWNDSLIRTSPAECPATPRIDRITALHTRQQFRRRQCIRLHFAQRRDTNAEQRHSVAPLPASPPPPGRIARPPCDDGGPSSPPRSRSCCCVWSENGGECHQLRLREQLLLWGVLWSSRRRCIDRRHGWRSCQRTGRLPSPAQRHPGGQVDGHLVRNRGSDLLM